MIEQDHRRVKWKMNHAMGYHTMWHASATVTGVEIMHMLRKGQAYFVRGKKEPQHLCHFILRLFDIPVPYLPSYSNRKSAF